MIFNETEEQEKAYLQQVLNIINDTINSTDKSVKEHIDTLQEYKDYLWSNKDIDPHEIRSMRESILNHFARGENVIDKRNRLSKILDIPYFGRIDFKENGSSGKKLPVYIYNPQNHLAADNKTTCFIFPLKQKTKRLKKRSKQHTKSVIQMLFKSH